MTTLQTVQFKVPSIFHAPFVQSAKSKHRLTGRPPLTQLLACVYNLTILTQNDVALTRYTKRKIESRTELCFCSK